MPQTGRHLCAHAQILHRVRKDSSEVFRLSGIHPHQVAALLRTILMDNYIHT